MMMNKMTKVNAGRVLLSVALFASAALSMAPMTHRVNATCTTATPGIEVRILKEVKREKAKPIKFEKGSRVMLNKFIHGQKLKNKGGEEKFETFFSAGEEVTIKNVVWNMVHIKSDDETVEDKWLSKSSFGFATVDIKYQVKDTNGKVYELRETELEPLWVAYPLLLNVGETGRINRHYIPEKNSKLMCGSFVKIIQNSKHNYCVQHTSGTDTAKVTGSKKYKTIEIPKHCVNALKPYTMGMRWALSEVDRARVWRHIPDSCYKTPEEQRYLKRKENVVVMGFSDDRAYVILQNQNCEKFELRTEEVSECLIPQHEYNRLKGKDFWREELKALKACSSPDAKLCRSIEITREDDVFKVYSEDLFPSDKTKSDSSDSGCTGYLIFSHRTHKLYRVRTSSFNTSGRYVLVKPSEKELRVRDRSMIIKNNWLCFYPQGFPHADVYFRFMEGDTTDKDYDNALDTDHHLSKKRQNLFNNLLKKLPKVDA